MDPDVAQRRLHEVQIQAYAALLRCLRDRSLSIPMLTRETLQTKVRLEFGIAPAQHKELLAQVAQEESQPSSAAPSLAYAPPAPKPAAIRKQPSKAAAKAKGHAVMDLNAHLPATAAHTVALTYVPPLIEGPADRKKAIQEVNYRKVQRWWPNEGGWWTAVVSKYNPDTGSCELVYNLDKKGQSIQSESYNMHAATVDHCKLTEEYASAAEIKKLKSSGG